MIFSLLKLREMARLNSKISNNQIIEAINNLGFEVEKISPMPQIEGIKWGKVLQTYPNPHSDNLTICEVKFSDKIRIIQTNAKNLAANDVVIAFVPGSKKNQFVFESKKLKQINSEGMLTSVDEFGLNQKLLFKNFQGINIYNDVVNWKINPIEFLQLNDTIIDVKILPNRIDANSYYSMALELSAFFKTEIVDKTILISEKSTTSISKQTNQKLSSNDLIIIDSKKQFTTTFQEKILLVKHGYDVSDEFINLQNLTLIMTGQVIYLFDKRKIIGNIKLQKASHNEFVDFEGQKLNFKNHLTISDSNNVVAIPGIKTLPLFLPQSTTESWQILLVNPSNPQIRENCKLTKVNNHFAIQANKLQNSQLINRTLFYLKSKLSDLKITILLRKYPKNSIKLNDHFINQIAGFDLTKSNKYHEIFKSLQKLGFVLEKDEITIPDYRNDVKTIEDVCEEIFRFYDYNQFPINKPVLNSQTIKPQFDLKSSLKSQGFTEVITYLLTSPEQNNFNPFDLKTIKLQTFTSLLRSEIRNSAVISLQEIVIHHFKQKILRYNFFEIGQIQNGIQVLTLVSSFLTFNDLKKILINLWGDCLVFKSLSNDDKINQFLHPGMSAKIYYQKQMIGYIGKLSPYIFDYDVMFVEIMFEKIKAVEFKLKPYSELPLKSRDLNLLVKQHQSINLELTKIKNIPGIIDIFVIDKFINNFNEQKITIRVVGTEQAIETFDKHF